MSIFSKITWIDQIKDALGNIIQQGTPVSANNMNCIEDGIEEALQDISTHVADEDNPHAVNKVDVGLGSADNTSDENKPVSIAQQNALNGKLNSDANAVSASKLATARNIALDGDASGSITFDGTANKTINVVVNDNSHTHLFSNITSKPTTLASFKKGSDTFLVGTSSKTVTDSFITVDAQVVVNPTAVKENYWEVVSYAGNFIITSREEPEGSASNEINAVTFDWSASKGGA